MLDPTVQVALITSASSLLGSTIWGMVMLMSSRRNRAILYETREEFDGKFKQLLGEKQSTAAMTGLQAGLDMAQAKAQNRREEDKE
jgi:hypothetical protein